MKYIFIFLLIFIVGCDNTKNHKSIKKQQETNITQMKQSIKEKPKQKIKKVNKIVIDDLTFIKQKNDILYSFKSKKILVFLNNNKLSNSQIEELKKLKTKYYIIRNKNLKEYFKIITFPTIIITKDTNHTKKYEGFMPYEILKYEIKDNN